MQRLFLLWRLHNFSCVGNSVRLCSIKIWIRLCFTTYDKQKGDIYTGSPQKQWMLGRVLEQTSEIWHTFIIAQCACSGANVTVVSQLVCTKNKWLHKFSLFHLIFEELTYPDIHLTLRFPPSPFYPVSHQNSGCTSTVSHKSHVSQQSRHSWYDH